ncbi:Ferrous iron transport protein B [Aquicella siphonis]|uniref:Ferrous iron transport protein B n=1 Tax=Aquicella siphonis TaxID=254247 RepID=A0A5E4PFB4_9COXI|nr:Fe(2+) transporter permease subunit FeoB [Aquicella siphonis]VVC75202.1 Ferrous iron transport protein B [Aquicella siphonis]
MTACCDARQHNEKPAEAEQARLTVALAGNPNCGKTTLFNALTGARQRVGNWPGVTVERKSGYFTQSGVTVEVTDLPGIYSLTLASQSAVDEAIAADFIASGAADLIIQVADASQLERHLYLTCQLLERGAPLLLALNMMDVARARSIRIDTAQLSRLLGCPVATLEANKGGGVPALKKMASDRGCASAAPARVSYPDIVQKAVRELAPQCGESLAVRLLEDDGEAQRQVLPEIRAQVREKQAQIQQAAGEDADILIADARYRFINQILASCVSRQTQNTTTWTSRIDAIVLNRVLGIPVFLGVMYLLFVFSINIGGAFQDFFDISSQALFVDGFAAGLAYLGAPAWLSALFADGIGKGINTTVTFIPVIGSMFLFLAFLEDSGYMARAAFVVDRFMRALGLPGKAFVPMIVGFGCNVPAVMGARTLENRRDRILTVMMTPFMSCGARLAIFAVFTAAFFPRGGQNIIFALYLTGILMAVLTGLLLRQTVLKGEPSPLVMELPVYHMPRMQTLLLHAWQRLKGFVYRAGRLIVPICVLIGALNALNLDGTMNNGEGGAHSLLSLAGQWVTPVFAPMGIQADNWPATVGLVTGVLAKEVVVGTLNTLYSQVGHLSAAGVAGGADILGGLMQALQSIPQNLSQLSSVFGNPVLAQAPIGTVNQGVYGLMYEQFDGQAGAAAYLLFVLLYFPCISTLAAMMRELHRGWALFSTFWMTGVAYGAAVAFYQAATFTRHPLSSAFWITGVITVFLVFIACARGYARQGTEGSMRSARLPAGETA